MAEPTLIWAVTRLECALDNTGQYGTVTAVLWKITTQNEDASVSSEGYTVLAPSEDNCEFTPFAEITESQVLGWVKAALGDVAVEDIESRAVADLTAKLIPQIIPVDPPWLETITIPPLDPVPEEPLPPQVGPIAPADSEPAPVMGTDMPTSEG